MILHAPKNGFFYVIDRNAGKLLSAEKVQKAMGGGGDMGAQPQYE